MSRDLLVGGDWVLIALVILGALPELAASWQFLLIAGHFRRHHYRACAPLFRSRRIGCS